jgi:hypothetical protein
LGKSVTLVTDGRNWDCLEACSLSVGGPGVLCAEGPHQVPDGLDLLIFIERPGHAGDGRYYNMEGRDISDVVAPLDRAAERALGCGVPVLGVGDGGNEAGMGLLFDDLAQRMPQYASCLSRVSATVCLPVDVSNWGAYALAALLSSLCRRWVGLDLGEEALMLRALLSVGAVDGISKLPESSVDGVPVARLNQVSLRIKNWYLDGLRT